MRKWWSTAPSGVKTFTFSRDMTEEEIEDVSRRMDDAFARMDDAFARMNEAFDELRRK